MAKVAIGARVDVLLQQGIEDIARRENRSVSVVIGEMVAGGLNRYRVGGWSAINKKEAKK